MPLWDALNHSLCSLATGGFSINDNNLLGYPIFSQIVAIFAMILGAISFSMHYQILIKRKFLQIFKSVQHVFLFLR